MGTNSTLSLPALAGLFFTEVYRSGFFQHPTTLTVPAPIAGFSRSALKEVNAFFFLRNKVELLWKSTQIVIPSCNQRNEVRKHDFRSQWNRAWESDFLAKMSVLSS